VIYTESELVERIFQEDGYRLVDVPAIEDLAIYKTSDNVHVLHVGRVVRLDSLGSVVIPWILSKWDDSSGEDEHPERDVPYQGQGIPFRIEYWTDR
jgi:hypothetical protein